MDQGRTFSRKDFLEEIHFYLSKVPGAPIIDSAWHIKFFKRPLSNEAGDVPYLFEEQEYNGGMSQGAIPAQGEVWGIPFEYAWWPDDSLLVISIPESQWPFDKSDSQWPPDDDDFASMY